MVNRKLKNEDVASADKSGQSRDFRRRRHIGTSSGLPNKEGGRDWHGRKAITNEGKRGVAPRLISNQGGQEKIKISGVHQARFSHGRNRGKE
jgi:hypothetical protein